MDHQKMVRIMKLSWIYQLAELDPDIDFIESIKSQYPTAIQTKEFTETSMGTAYINKESLEVLDNELMDILTQKYLPAYISPSIKGHRENTIIPATFGFLRKRNMPQQQMEAVLQWINDVAEIKKEGTPDHRNYNFNNNPKMLAGSGVLKEHGFDDFVDAINSLDPEYKIIQTDSGTDITLEYPTKHLKHFDDLETASNLFGNEYKIIFKALWYQLMSFKIRESDIKMGRNRVDGRINALYPLKAGHGKGELKRMIKEFTKYFDKVYAEPTSLHAEQLVGKTVKSKKGNDYSYRYGYLHRDWLVIDEAFNLLSSNELHYSEARKYIRTALDHYPGNTIHKETTEIGDKAPLEYDPKCPVTIFLQPKVFDNDILVLEGDIRRVICPYVNMTGIDKTESYKRNIFDESDDQQAMETFCKYVSTIESFETFRATTDAKVKFMELFFDMRNHAINFNDKIRNFFDIEDYTIQTQLLKFSAIQSLQHGRNQNPT